MGRLDMPHWSLGHSADFDIIQEIEKGSDRVTIIVGLALIDDKLTDAIKATLHQFENKTVENWFGEHGFYKDFRIKTDIAFMLNVFGTVTYGDLLLLAKARNEVAHKSRHKAFRSASVKGHCRDLKLPDLMGRDVEHLDRTDPRDRFLFTVAKITDHLGLLTYLKNKNQSPDNGRLP
jgi:hypothetical protein